MWLDKKNTDVNAPTTKFDKCGMISFWKDKPNDEDIIVPSKYFKNLTHFMDVIKPPFFGDYKVILVAGSCFNNAKALALGISAFLLLLEIWD